MAFVDAKDAAKVMSDYVNSMGHDPKEFVAQMARDHRTLQQSFTALTLEWLKHLSELNHGEYDGRNEYSVQIAKKLMKGIEDWEIQTPFI